MGLKPDSRDAIVASMAPTKKGLKAAQSEGGFFYFVSDAKGMESALIVHGKGKDGDGKKTFRIGRGLLKDFKSGKVKPFFCQGSIEAGSPLRFAIDKGTAKPTVLKNAFKKSDLLADGLGASLVGLLKSAKIGVAKAESSSTPETPDAPDTPDSKAAAISADELASFRSKPEIAAMITELALSDEEVEELLVAEKAFGEQAKLLPRPADEEQALQERQAETEALLDELSKGAEELETLKSTDIEAARKLEQSLNDKRIELARKNAVGPNPFAEDALDGPDREALNAALLAGITLLIEQVKAVRSEVQELPESPDPSQSATVETLDGDLLALQGQFDRLKKS